MKNLKFIRANLRKTQFQVAQDLGIPVTTYATYEQEKATPSTPLMIKIADYFGCSVDYLIGHTTNTDLSPAQQQLIPMIKLLNDSQVNFLIGWCSNALGLPYDSAKPVAPWN